MNRQARDLQKSLQSGQNHSKPFPTIKEPTDLGLFSGIDALCETMILSVVIGTHRDLTQSWCQPGNGPAMMKVRRFPQERSGDARNGSAYVAALIVNGLILALIVFVPLGVLAYLTVCVIRTRRATKE